jgi:hypothetical protein
MTEVNGLRLAYRGFVAGLAGAYVWAAIAMVLSGIFAGDPLRPLRPIAEALTPLATSSELAFVLGLAAIQLGGAVVGMCFAYFFGRFFTVRATLTIAAPAVAVLVWAIVATALVRTTGTDELSMAAIPIVATIGYGLLVGAAVPVRAEVSRQPGSPST